MYSSPPEYGSFKKLSSSAMKCCSPGTSVSTSGALVVKVTNLKSSSLGLSEIEIYDSQGKNVGRDATCYSKQSFKDDDFGPDCLNDGKVGSSFCSSLSKTANSKNYDFCVLDTLTDISSIKIFPSGVLGNLRVDIYADIDDIQDLHDPSQEKGIASFIGLLRSYTVSANNGSYHQSGKNIFELTNANV
jgi:hypothetical protein